MTAVARNGLQEIPLLVGQGSAEVLGEEEVGEPDDAVERRAELVGNVRQELVLRLHCPVELAVQLFEPLGGLPHFHREPPRVVMRRAAFAGDREIGSRLVERGALVSAERRTGHDTQYADQLRARAQRDEYQALRHSDRQAELMPHRLHGFAVIMERLRGVANEISHRRAGNRLGTCFDAA